MMPSLTRCLPLLLAAGLQLLPLLRNVVATPTAANAFAIVLRWGIGAGAVVGSVDAVSGATSVFTTPSTYNGAVGVAFNNRVTVSIGGGNTAAANDYFFLSSGGTNSNLLLNNQSTTVTLPPGLTFTASWVDGASTIGGVITGTPTTAGTYATTVTVVSPGNASLSQGLTLKINGSATPTPPSLTTQPANVTVSTGTTATFSATANGTTPLGFFWAKDNSPLTDGGHISGANASTLTLSNVTVNDVGNYSLLVSNTLGTASSSNALLTVLVPPSIIADPTDATVIVSNQVTFTVAANGTAPVNYQWRKNNTVIPGATSATLTLTNVQPTNAGNYSVFVSNAAGNATSATAILIVQTAPSLVTQPVNQAALQGNPVTLTVNATGTTPLSYQWFKDNSALAEAGNFSGTTTNTLTIAALTTNDVGIYFVVVSNFLGTATSTNVSVTENIAPLITVSPTSQIVAISNNVTFTATANGTTPLIWQWRKNGTNLTNSTSLIGATTPTLTLLNVKTNQNGNYAVFVTNFFGNATSAVATLTVQSLPRITAGPTNRVAKTGTNVAFAVTATGTGPLNYQWFKDGSPLADGGNVSGSTTNVLRLTNLTTADAGNYLVTVTNAVGNATSTNAALTVLVLPAIVTQPASQSVTLSNAANFSVSATGAALRYQWRKNASVIPGATNNSFTIATAKTTDAATYSVVITNLAGSVSSSNATLTVNIRPTFSLQATNRWAKAGTNTIFRATVTGTLPINYQWFKNGSALLDEGNVSGAFSNVLTVVNLTTNDAGAFTLTATNVAGSATSSNAVLTVVVKPSVIESPTNQAIVISKAVTFSVSAAGSDPLRYQWRKGTAAITGATNIFFALTSVRTNDAGAYAVVITNRAGSVTSSVATLSVLLPPKFLLQATNRFTKVGTNSIFIATVSGTAPLSYQWFKAGSPLVDGGNIFGANSNVLRVVVLSTNDNGAYSLFVSNVVAAANSSNAVLTVLLPPSIVAQPTNQAVVVSNAVTFTIFAEGTAPLRYQWRKGTAAIKDATNSSFTIPIAKLTDAATNYSVVITNRAGLLASSNVTLTVLATALVTPHSVATTVFPSAIELIISRNPDGCMTLKLLGAPLENYFLQVTDTLDANANWNTLGSATSSANGSWQMTDTDTGNHAVRFYRVLKL